MSAISKFDQTWEGRLVQSTASIGALTMAQIIVFSAVVGNETHRVVGCDVLGMKFDEV